MASIKVVETILSFVLITGHKPRRYNSTSSHSSAASSISTKEIEDIILKLCNSKYRPATKCNYQSVWKVFSEFFVTLDRKPRNWSDHITLFVGYLVSCDKQSCTIKSYLSAIKAVLKDNDIIIDQDQFLLSSLTRACRLRNDKVQQRLPIQKGLLLLLLRRVQDYFETQPFLATMYKALFSTAYFGLFRVGELTMTFSQHAVLAQDVHIASNQYKILFVLRTSKTHGLGHKPQKLKISSKPLCSETTVKLEGETFCPYDLLKKYLRIRGTYRTFNEQIFVFSDTLPV